jgi:hypothetical protein
MRVWKHVVKWATYLVVPVKRSNEEAVMTPWKSCVKWATYFTSVIVLALVAPQVALADTIQTKCNWADAIAPLFNTLAGEFKGVAYEVGPAAVVILFVLFILLFRHSMRGSLIVWLVVIVAGLSLLGSIGNITGVFHTGGGC